MIDPRMIDWTHVVERAIIHFFSSGGVYLIAVWGFWLLERRARWWPQLRGWWEFILPAAFSFLFISLREVFDVGAGGAALKSVCDWLSWAAGLGASAWALYRLAPRLAAVRAEIEEARRPTKNG